MSKSEQQIVAQALRTGQPIPERINNAPELNAGLQLYLEAFFDLDSERSQGLGLSPIPWSSIKYYAEAYDFDEYQTYCLFLFIKKMDSAHLKRLEVKQNRSNENAF